MPFLIVKTQEIRLAQGIAGNSSLSKHHEIPAFNAGISWYLRSMLTRE
jgi:hypothetical protein